MNRQLSLFAKHLPLADSLRRAGLHTARQLRRDNLYEILDLEPNASPSDIKKQYFHLSKKHHPDRHPSHPEATEQFVKISEAYATLGDPEKRQQYDSANPSSRHAPSRTPHSGSYSSASTPYGARPASGLSRRRTQFKGPPPSFYRSGGWGSHGTRRQAQAQGAAGSSSSDRSPHPEQWQNGMDNEAPHFDQASHYRTQQSHEERFKTRKQNRNADDADAGGESDVISRFLIVSGVVAVAYLPIFLIRRESVMHGAQEKKAHR